MESREEGSGAQERASVGQKEVNREVVLKAKGRAF